LKNRERKVLFLHGKGGKGVIRGPRQKKKKAGLMLPGGKERKEVRSQGLGGKILEKNRRKFSCANRKRGRLSSSRGKGGKKIEKRRPPDRGRGRRTRP